MIRSQLAVLILVFVVTGEAMAKSEEVIATGIPATLGHQACWLDDTRLIIMQKTQPPHGEPETEGLYVLDVTKPHELTRIDLTPLSLTLQREIIRLSCQEQTIVFSRLLPGRQISEFYTMTLGRPPERLGELRGAPVSVRGRYLLGSSEKVIHDIGPLQGTFEGNDDCDVRYVRPGFRVLCWDSFLFRNWPLTTFVLSEYQWQETIKVRAEDGTAKRIPNPTTPLIGKDGNQVRYGLYLRDLNGQIVANLTEDPRYAPWIDYGLAVTPDDAYVYASCSLRTRPIGLATGVCRYRLDGKPHEWEEVFRFDALEGLKASIQKKSVSIAGGVYFDVPGARIPHAGIWRFDVTSRKIEQLTSNSQIYRDEDSSVSPHGVWAIFVRSEKDGAKFMLLQGGVR